MDPIKEILGTDFKLDSSEEESYQKVFNKVTKRVLKKARELDKHLPVLFNSANYDGAFEQGFKTKGNLSTFTLYIDFKLPTTKWKLVGLGEDMSRPSECQLNIPEPSNQEAWKSLMEVDQDGRSFVSPSNMIAVLVQAVDQVLVSVKNSVKIGNDIYSVSRREQQSSQYLFVRGPGINFAVELLPCFTLQMKHLKGFPALMENIEEVVTKAKEDFKTFKVIAKSTGSKMELTFPYIEQCLLKHAGCLRELMTRLHHHMSTQNETVPNDWALVLKACLLHLVIEHLGETDFWDESNLEERTEECLERVFSQLQQNAVTDIFLPQVFVILCTV